MLISEQTYRHIVGHFNCQDLGAIQVRGRRQPVHIYQATAVRKWRGLALVCYQEALQWSRDLGDRQEERAILATK